MKTPKQRFQETEHLSAFAALVEHPGFLAALDAAMGQMLYEQPLQSMAARETDTVLATANAFRMEGAKRFVTILTTLPMVSAPKTITAMRDNLEP